MMNTTKVSTEEGEGRRVTEANYDDRKIFLIFIFPLSGKMWDSTIFRTGSKHPEVMLKETSDQ
jgi:hypothetical protein